MATTLGEIDALDLALDGLLAEQSLRQGEIARVAAHADADGWQAWHRRIMDAVRSAFGGQAAPAEGMRALRERKLRERAEREQRG